MKSTPSLLQDRIFHAVRKLIDKMNFSVRKNSLEIEGVKLHTSEIHLILYIGHGGDQARNATRIAEAMGVTKGAISQNLQRLCNKGILIKESIGSRKNELELALTPLGSSAFASCQILVKQFQQSHDSLFEGISDEGKEAILVYLQRLNSML